jgi:hypothetical protein
MAKDMSLDAYENGKARLVKRYLCTLCGHETDHMGICGMTKNKDRPNDYELGCERCLTRWTEFRLVIIDECDHKELAEAMRIARKHRHEHKFKLLPEWEADILALEKVLLRPSEQRGGN